MTQSADATRPRPAHTKQSPARKGAVEVLDTDGRFASADDLAQTTVPPKRRVSY